MYRDKEQQPLICFDYCLLNYIQNKENKLLILPFNALFHLKMEQQLQHLRWNGGCVYWFLGLGLSKYT